MYMIVRTIDISGRKFIIFKASRKFFVTWKVKKVSLDHKVPQLVVRLVFYIKKKLNASVISAGVFQWDAIIFLSAVQIEFCYYFMFLSCI